MTELGTQFQPNAFGLFDASISDYDAGNNLIGTFVITGNNGPNIGSNSGDNSNKFLGFNNTKRDAPIRRMLFSTTNDGLGFANNQVSFGNNAAAAVPEPSTYAMFGLGILALVALSRRERKDSPSNAFAFNGATC